MNISDSFSNAKKFTIGLLFFVVAWVVLLLLGIATSEITDYFSITPDETFYIGRDHWFFFYPVYFLNLCFMGLCICSIGYFAWAIFVGICQLLTFCGGIIMDLFGGKKKA